MCVCNFAVFLRWLQVAPLDLSGVDLSQPSGQKLRFEHKWTAHLILKLAAPVVLSMVSSATTWQDGAPPR